jgi:hypothetical protein
MSYSLAALRASGIAQFTANSASTSTTSGSVRVTGGIGVSGDLFSKSVNAIDSSLTEAYIRTGHDITGNFNSGYMKFNYIGDDDLTNNLTLGFTTTGGVDENIYTIGRTSCRVLSTTNSSSKTTGALTVAGGLGVNNNLYVGDSLNVGSLTASQSVQTDSSKNLVTIANTGTGSNVLANSPSLVTPSLGAATGTSLNLSGLTASQAVFTDGSKNLVSVATNGSGNVVLTTSPTLITPVLGTASATSLSLSSLTANTILQCDGSKVITSATSTGTGNVVRENTPTLTTPILGVASATSLAATSSTDATSTSTGAITSVGGISSQKNIFAAGFNAINTATAPRINLKYDGGNFNGSFLKYNYVGNDNTANTFSLGFTTPGSDQTAMTYGRDSINIPYTTTSSSSTTGALTIGGGLGLAGDLVSAGTVGGTYLRTDPFSFKYKTGTFTPGAKIYQSNSEFNAGTITYSNCTYVKIGKLVSVSFEIIYDMPGAPALSATVYDGLPFTIDSNIVQVPASFRCNFAGVTNPALAFSLTYNGYTYENGSGIQYTSDGKSLVALYVAAFGSDWAMATSQLGPTTNQKISFAFSYYCNDPY